jgi:hypothetical protein
MFDLALDDTLRIYDGNSINAPVIKQLTGVGIPDPIQSTGNQMLINFITNDANLAQGWAAGYTSVLPVYCKDTLHLTSETGVFEDGSGNKNYVNNSECYWMIEPVDAEHITIYFEEFDLEFGYDQLRIYNASEFPLVELALLTGHQIPDPITMKGNRMLVRFTTDISHNYDGWKILYTNQEQDINEYPDNDKLNIYPIPVHNELQARIAPDLMGCHYTIYSATGQQLLNGIIDKQITIIDTEKLSSGVYLFIINDSANIVLKKFVK